MNSIIRTVEVKLDSTPRRNKNAKPVFVYKGGFGTGVYASGLDAAAKLNLDPGDISRVCNGKMYSAKGYKMCFVKDMPEHILEIVNAINGIDEEAERKKAEEAERKRKKAKEMQDKINKMLAKLEQAQAEYDAFMGDE